MEHSTRDKETGMGFLFEFFFLYENPIGFSMEAENYWTGSIFELDKLSQMWLMPIDH